MIEGLVVLAALVVVGFSLLAYGLAWQSDERREAEQRQALREAVEKTREVIGEFPSLQHQGLRLIERESGVKGLRLESDPAAKSNLQSVVDRKGRIIAWIGFDPDRPISSFLRLLWPLFVGFALALGVVGASLIWQSRRLRALLEDYQTRLRRLEKHDQVTGLSDHRGMLEVISATLATRKPGEVTALVDLDLDRFADINDGLGYEFGDRVLAAFAQRLQSSLGAGMACGRLVGDEFAVVFNSPDAHSVSQTVAALHEVLARPVWISDRAVQIGISIGLVIAPDHGVERGELLRRACFALRSAKAAGRGRICTFDSSMDASFNDSRALERDLKRAIAQDDLRILYQPIVASDGSRIVGVEALLRWDHPEHGSITPLVFIPAAEQAGLMDALGEFVLRRALSDARRWPELYMSVNVSAMQVRDRKFVELVARLLQENMIPPSRLVLEMTESVLINNPEEAKARLDALRGLGVRIALDDFGTGYSSLSYLQRFAFDKLKIDKAFVTPLGRSANSNAMIQAIVALGNALGLSILAEGVETEEQRVLLRLAGCHEMQGFLFAMPSTRDAIDAIVAEAKLRAAGRTAGAAS